VLAVVALAATAIKGGGSVTGVVAEADTVNGAPAVQINWRDSLWAGNSIEYHIWRLPDDPFNFQGTPIAAVQQSRHYTDFPAPYSFWDGVRGFNQPPFNNQNNQQGGQGLSAIVSPALNAVSGFAVGRSFVYQVTQITRRTALLNNNNGQQNNNQNNVLEDVETAPVNSGQSTPINQPLLDLPRETTANINIQSATFSWLSRAGADTYVLEFSTDRTFMNRNLVFQVPTQFFSPSVTAEGAIIAVSAPIDLSTNATLKRDVIFNNFVNRVPGAGRPTIYWRVGGRNNQDSPGPVHWFSRNPKDSDRTFRFIYSQVRSFTPADLPPPPP
jgi:hypothetical protein